MAGHDELDQTLQLEAVYYPAPMPRNRGVLVAMGFAFDRVHFPGVYLPRGDYDRAAWQREIDRIAGHNLKDYDSQALLAMMRFASEAEKLEGFCCFGRSRDDPLDGDKDDKDLVHQLYHALWGPPRPDFIPMFQTWHHKGVGQSEEHLTYPGDYFYQAGALRTAGETGALLLTDATMPIPSIDGDEAADAKALSAFISMEAMKLILPDMPLLGPEDLMEFRDENKAHLRGFRRAMLRYAGAWREQLAGHSPEDLARETEFLVQTEIVPALDELRQLASDPARPWHKRAIDGIAIGASVAGSCITMQWDKAISKLMEALAPQFFKEVDAKGDKREALRRSDLYYLLQVQRVRA